MVYENLLGTILVVDDEKTTRLALCEALNQVGYQAYPAASAEEAMESIPGRSFDVVLLDLQMPGVGGAALLAKANEIAPNVSFIVFTAYGSTDSAIMALRSGAVDYLLKPCSLNTIIEAVQRALTRRHERNGQLQALALLEQAMATLHPNKVAPRPEQAPAGTDLIHLGNITVNRHQQTVLYGKQPLELTPTEYRLLLVFVQQPGRILSYRELARQSHQSDIDENEARVLLRTHLFRLSHKLSERGQSPLQLVRGRGYILLNQPSAEIPWLC